MKSRPCACGAVAQAAGYGRKWRETVDSFDAAADTILRACGQETHKPGESCLIRVMRRILL